MLGNFIASSMHSHSELPTSKLIVTECAAFRRNPNLETAQSTSSSFFLSFFFCKERGFVEFYLDVFLGACNCCSEETASICSACSELLTVGMRLPFAAQRTSKHAMAWLKETPMPCAVSLYLSVSLKRRQTHKTYHASTTFLLDRYSIPTLGTNRMGSVRLTGFEGRLINGLYLHPVVQLKLKN